MQKCDFAESTWAKCLNAHKVRSGYCCELEAQWAVHSILVTLLKLFLYGSKNKDSALIKHDCEHFRLADGQTMLQFKDFLNGSAVLLGTVTWRTAFQTHSWIEYLTSTLNCNTLCVCVCVRVFIHIYFQGEKRNTWLSWKRHLNTWPKDEPPAKWKKKMKKKLL